jgi:hypothetical protein
MKRSHLLLLLLAGLLLLSSPATKADIHGDCCNTWVVIDNRPGTAGFNANWKCDPGMASLASDLRAKACQELNAKNKTCPEAVKYCGVAAAADGKRNPCDDLAEQAQRLKDEIRTKWQPEYNKLNSVELENEMKARENVIQDQKQMIKDINRKKMGNYKMEVRELRENVETSQNVIKKHRTDRTAAYRNLQDAADRATKINKQQEKKGCLKPRPPSR